MKIILELFVKGICFIILSFVLVGIFGVINHFLLQTMLPGDPMYLLSWVALFVAFYFSFLRPESKKGKIEKNEALLDSVSE